MTRHLKICFIIIFLVLISAPYLQKQFHVLPDFALNEKRSKITRPKNLNLLLEPGGVYARLYEDSYNDTYGLRDLLIRSKNQLDYWVFQSSEKVLIGRDGWLFYKSVVEKEQIYVEKSSQESFNRMFANLLKFNRLLADRGITLVILPCPMKNAIYPEKLPIIAPQRPKPTGFERYLEFLRSHPEIVTLDPTPRLRELKGEFDVYYKTDFHWTDLAGAYVARDLVNLLGQKAGLVSVWTHPIKSKCAERTDGGENNSLALLWPIRERFITLDTAGIDTATGTYTKTGDAKEKEWSYNTLLTDTSRLMPCTVMFSDSFADPFDAAGFTRYFSQFQRYYNRSFKEKFPEIPPNTRFLVLEHTELWLSKIWQDDFWPDEVLN